ncbi:MAG: alpha/beta hydrolase [Actinomycetota bacterium]|nr:alpha/beta hydrolase [Actinomycetota bacterium]
MASQQMVDTIKSIRQANIAGGNATPPPLPEMRKEIEQFLLSFPQIGGVINRPQDANGVPGEWTLLDSAPDVTRTILYFHGGGFVAGSALGNRRIVSSLALAAGARALSMDYRLAPENPFPAALDDAVTAYDWLIREGGVAPSEVIFAGDSAGANLAAALLLRLSDEDKALPAGAFLISPALDYAATGGSRVSQLENDPFAMSADFLADVKSMYAPDTDSRHPYLSPLNGQFKGFPAILVHVGEYEGLLDDAVRLAEKAQAVGVDAQLTVWEGAFHVFHQYVGLVPESDQAIAEAGAWMAARFDAPVSA